MVNKSCDNCIHNKVCNIKNKYDNFIKEVNKIESELFSNCGILDSAEKLDNFNINITCNHYRSLNSGFYKDNLLTRDFKNQQSNEDHFSYLY